MHARAALDQTSRSKSTKAAAIEYIEKGTVTYPSETPPRCDACGQVVPEMVA
jgi:hypothetical protein